MSFFPAVVLLCVAVGVVVALAFAVTTRHREETPFVDSQGSGEIESELLRRPLRSRID